MEPLSLRVCSCQPEAYSSFRGYSSLLGGLDFFQAQRLEVRVSAYRDLLAPLHTSRNLKYYVLSRIRVGTSEDLLPVAYSTRSYRDYYHDYDSLGSQ